MATSTPGPKKGLASSVSTPAVATSATTSATIEFDPAGDLYLTVGNSPPQEMLVESRTLCRSSVVFRKMLSNQFSEAKPDKGRWEVKLPDDNPDAFAILMDMIHGVYDRTTVDLGLPQIFGVCVLTNKYDMAQGLRPMAFRWLDRFISKATTTTFTLDYAKIPCATEMLFIAWEMGHDRIFEAMVKRITLHFRTNDDDELISPDGHLLRDDKFVGLCGIYESITRARKEIVAAFRKSHRAMIKQLLEKTSPERFCRLNGCSKFQGSPKSAAILGDILQGSFEYGLMEDFDQDGKYPKFTGNLHDLEEYIKKIKDSTMSCFCGGPMILVLKSVATHRECRMLRMMPPLHKEHLSIQAAKSKVLKEA